MTLTTEMNVAREILDAVHAMEPGLTMNDRTVFIAGHLAKARREGREEMARYIDNFCARSPSCSRSFE